MKDIGVGVLGWGTVGAGVVEGLLQRADRLASRARVRPVLRRIADLDLDRDRGYTVDRAMLTTDPASVIEDPAVGVVVELIGGTGVAGELIRHALRLGKPVVTANKALLAAQGAELFAAAKAGGTGIYFEASVGGGIPIIRALRQGLIANRVRSVYGILNGTSNYILTRMESEDIPFDRALRKAQAEGYAEADPSLDIDGHDSAHKIAILAALAYGAAPPPSAVPAEGIRRITSQDIAFARELGYRIKLLASTRVLADGIGIGVQPALVPHGHLLASVGGVFNAIVVDGDLTGETLYYGRGAGRNPTASAVLSDIADAAKHLHGDPEGFPSGWSAASESVPRWFGPDDSPGRFYLRMLLKDRPGILARVAQVLGEHGISIASVMQRETAAGRHVPVIFITHEIAGRRVAEAIAAIDRLDCVGAPTVRFRIEDFSFAQT